MMLQPLHNSMKRLSSRWGILISFVLAHMVLLIMMLFTFPIINAKMEGKAFDLMTFGYSFDEARSRIGNLDPPTTDLYIFPQLLLLDVLYPLLLAIFLSSLIIRLLKLNRISGESRFSYFFLLPFFAMLFDYLENAAILHMITKPESFSKEFVGMASSLTILKSSFTILSWTLVLVLTVGWLSKKYKESKHE